jgi:hypothetical protein
MKRKILEPGDRVLAARPDSASGPGWRNEPIWVYVQRNGGAIREECLQPDEQTGNMALLFDVVEAGQRELIGEIERACR